MEAGEECTKSKQSTQKKLRRKELRHRAQSLIEGATDPWDDSDEYEMVIPEEEEQEFVDEGTAELAEEVIEYTNSGRELLCEAILGYIWWSIVFAIAPMIWFYPLNELEISGYEAFVVTILSPVLTGLSFIMVFCQSLHGIAVLRGLSMIGIASFQAPSTLTRLILLAFGCGTAMLWFCGIMWNKKARERSICFWGLILGFFIMLASRALYISINPVWGDGNRFVLLLGVIALLDRVYTGYISDAQSDSKQIPSIKDSKVNGPGWILVGLGFGALLFLTNTVFGEISLVCRWAVAGYPDIGPSPNPWGFLVFLALAIGILLSPFNFTSSVLWWIVGSLGAAALYFAPRHWSFCGGLVLALYIMSIWPSMIDRLFCRSPAGTLTLANVVYIILVLSSVWVVAYNFVPGGEYTRERTHVVLGISMVLIGLALTTRSSPDSKELYGKAKKEDAPIEEKAAPQSYEFNNIAFPVDNGDRYRLFNTHVKPALWFLVLAVGVIMFLRNSHLQYKTPVKEDPRVFSALIWTVHFGYDNKGWPSFERAARLIEDTDADIVGFLESDTSKPYLGNNDLAGWFQERLGMYPDFGPSTRDHTWGATLLSKYPFVKSQHHLLPSPEGELAPAISATLNISGSLVDVVLVHMGNDRDDLDRKLQAQELARIMNDSPNPLVFLGYVTSKPGSRDYHTMLNHGRMKDIDETDKERWCEYIFYRGLTRLGYARISHGGLSDTELQMAKFRIPADKDNYMDHPVMTKSSMSVPKHLHFTERFGSYFGWHYTGDHHYHMATPKYFLPK